MADVMKAGSIVGGASVPLFLQSTVDEPGRSLTRPSVLAGVGGGVGMVGLGYAVSNGMIGAPVGSDRAFSDYAYMAGLGLLTTGTWSALTGTASSNSIAAPSF